MRKFETFVGDHIFNVASRALAHANFWGDAVEFTFNEAVVVVYPDESEEIIIARWNERFDGAHSKRQYPSDSRAYKLKEPETVIPVLSGSSAAGQAILNEPEQLVAKRRRPIYLED